MFVYQRVILVYYPVNSGVCLYYYPVNDHYYPYTSTVYIYMPIQMHTHTQR